MFLALDTSTLTLSLALVEREGEGVRVLEHVVVGPPKKQSEALPGIVGELLARHGVALKSLEGMAIGLGPGSFTGLRIGLSCLKGLAYAAGLKVAGASSLAAVALEGPEGPPLFALEPHYVRASEPERNPKFPPLPGPPPTARLKED